MSTNKMICSCKKVRYIDIKRAMLQGARTVADVEKINGASSGCYKISVESVIDAVNQGARTFPEVAVITKAGLACGQCRELIESIILSTLSDKK